VEAQSDAPFERGLVRFQIGPSVSAAYPNDFNQRNFAPDESKTGRYGIVCFFFQGLPAMRESLRLQRRFVLPQRGVNWSLD
jgi:hypothetical protein